MEEAVEVVLEAKVQLTSAHERIQFWFGAVFSFIKVLIFIGCAILVFFIVTQQSSLAGYGASPILCCVAFVLQIATAIIMNLDILMNLVII